MNDFCQNILNDSIARLRSLQADLKDNFSHESRREAFRLIHSVKGLSQTFGFSNAAQIAENLENFLATAKSRTPETENFLSESLDLLINSLQDKSFHLPADFFENFLNQTEFSGGQIFLTSISPKLIKKLSENEKKKIISAYRDRKNIFAAEVVFEKPDFAKSYKTFQQKIIEDGEIIAALPDDQVKNAKKLGFLVIFSNSLTFEENLHATAGFASRIISYSLLAQSLSKEWLTMLQQVIMHHEKTAQMLEKNSGLTILTNDVRNSENFARTLFEILLHLVRNSLVHAFEKSGNIEVLALADEKNLHLEFADNGKGIDILQIKQLAIEKQIISANAEWTEQQILELIFAPEFSTAEKASALAGRGVGLDTVRHAVQKLNGKISVQSRKNHGTKFEIILPIIV